MMGIKKVIRMYGTSGLFMLGMQSLYAQKLVEQDTLTGKVHQLEKVTVVAPHIVHKVASTVPIQQFSQQHIQDFGIQSMADAVRRFAGASVRDYGGVGGLKTVSIRNMGAAHTAVSYDGVPVSNCQAGQIDIGRFSLDNVSLLSLSIGQSEDPLQAAKLYASAGVLSIQTEKPHFEDGRKRVFQIKLRGGSFGYITPYIRWWQQIGSRTQLSVDVNYMRTDGQYPFTLVNGSLVIREQRINSDVQSWQSEAALYHTFRDNSTLDVKGQYYYSRRGLPGAIILYNPTTSERLWDENYFVQARYRKHFSDAWSLQAQAKYNYAWNRYTDKGQQYASGYYQELHRQNEYYLSATLLYRPISTLTVSLAQDGQINYLHSTLPDCPFPTRYTSITALHANWQWECITATATAMYTATSEHVKIGKAPDNFHWFTPSVSVSIQPWKEQSLYVRLMYKNTFRLPTFNDLYYYQMGNRNLRPEKANEYNMGITWSCSKCSLFDYLSLTVDGYYNDVTDKIVAFPTTYAWKMANFGKVHAAGIDVATSVTLPLIRWAKLNVMGGYTWQKAIDVTKPDAKNYKDQLPYTPMHSGNGGITVEMPWVNVGYSLVGMGKRYYMAQNIPQNEIDSYVEQTVSLSHEFGFRRCKLDVQAELVNLADKQYAVIKYYPMPGRSWRLTGIFKF